MTSRISTIDVSCPICGQTQSNAQRVVLTQDYAYQTCSNTFTYLRCNGCGVTYLANQPTESSLGIIYPNSYTAHATNQGLLALIRRLNFQKKFFVARRFLCQRNRPLRVLDFGCGNGEMVRAIAELPGKLVLSSVGYDNSDSVTRSTVESRNSFLISNHLDDVLALGPFDLVFLNQVIEHLPHPIQTLSKIRSSMSPGGVIAIETPSLSGLEFKVRSSTFWGGWHAPRHFLIFDPATIGQLLSKVGFSVVKLSYIPSPYMWSQTLTAGRRHKLWKRAISITNIFFLVLITFVDLVCIKLRVKTSNMRVIAVNSEC